MKRKGGKRPVKKDEKNGEAINGDVVEENGEPEEKKSRTSIRGGASKKKEKNSIIAAVEESDDSGENYEVEAVLDEKKIKGIRHYLIRWKGYEPESDTWEPESTLDCPDLIADFQSKQKKKRTTKSPSKTPAKKTPSTWSENENFEVERIVEVDYTKDGHREFLVSWKGYPASQNTWEPEENMNCKDLIEKFMAKVEKNQGREVRAVRKYTPDAVSGRRTSKRQQGKGRVSYQDE